GQTVLSGAQALLIILDLRLQKLLRVFRPLALASQGLLHEGGQEGLDHAQSSITARVRVVKAVDRSGGAALIALAAGTDHGQRDAVAQHGEDSGAVALVRDRN